MPYPSLIRIPLPQQHHTDRDDLPVTTYHLRKLTDHQQKVVVSLLPHAAHLRQLAVMVALHNERGKRTRYREAIAELSSLTGLRGPHFNRIARILITSLGVSALSASDNGRHITVPNLADLILLLQKPR